jgi:hypothetical protein
MELSSLLHQLDDRRTQLRGVDVLGDQVDGRFVATPQDA